MSKRVSYLSNPLKSNSSSKAPSRTQSRTGFADDDAGAELINDISFGNLDELLSQRLKQVLSLHEESLSTAKDEEQPEKKKDVARLHSIPLILKTLESRDVSSDERKILLQKLYDLIIVRPTLEDEYPHEYDYETDLLKLVRSLQTARDQDELALINRALAVFIATNIDCASAVFSEDKSQNILALLEKKFIDETTTQDVKAQLIYAYTALILTLHDESGGFGIDDNLRFLIDQLETLVVDPVPNQSTLNAVIYGIGSTLTLIVTHSNLNELIEEVLELTVDLLTEIETPEILKPIAMLFGLSYEIYDYQDDELDPEDDYTPLPYLNTHSIISRLDELVKSSSKKVSKKDKKEGRSIYRDVLKTVEIYSDLNRRLQFVNPTPGEEREEFTLSHLKLSKSRSLAVKSWFAFFRLVQLKYLFTAGLHTQLANNSRLKSIIRDKPSNSYASQFNNNDGAEDQEFNWRDEGIKREQGKLKQEKRETERRAKLEGVLEQQGVKDHQ